LRGRRSAFYRITVAVNIRQVVDDADPGMLNHF
jgi:hypothetical protein